MVESYVNTLKDGQDGHDAEALDLIQQIIAMGGEEATDFDCLELIFEVLTEWRRYYQSELSAPAATYHVAGRGPYSFVGIFAGKIVCVGPPTPFNGNIYSLRERGDAKHS